MFLPMRSNPICSKLYGKSGNVLSISASLPGFRHACNITNRQSVFIANAGIGDKTSFYNLSRRSEPVDSIPPIPDLSCTEINYKGTVYGTILAIHFMRHNPIPGGKIIFTSSVIGIYACPIIPEYSCTKAASVALARSMAPVLLRQDNITINVVLPGGYDTDIMPDFNTAFLPQQYVHMLSFPDLLSSDTYLVRG